jgi:hypothetical protein
MNTHEELKRIEREAAAYSAELDKIVEQARGYGYSADIRSMPDGKNAVHVDGGRFGDFFFYSLPQWRAWVGIARSYGQEGAGGGGKT